jgi:uncharacterized protein (TIGR03083 family)
MPVKLTKARPVGGHVSRIHGSKDFWLAALRGDGAAFLATVGEPDAVLSAVPSCPNWTVGDLTRHLGAVYRRTRLNAGSAGVDEHWGAVVVPDEAPAANDESVVSWFAAELSQIEAFLEALDPDLPAWNWAPQARVAGFWHRRMAHETAVHRWDAQVATRLPEPLESKLAGDTVAEALDTFLAAGRRRASHADVTGLVHLTATDLGQEWYVRLRGAGVALLDTDTLLDDDAHPARAAASGTASDLALALWGRITFEVVETAGDVGLLEALRVT